MQTDGSQPRSRVLDREDLLARVDGDLALLTELAELFFENLPERLEETRAAIEAGDCERLARCAHALKGSTSNLSAPLALEAARELERLALDEARAELESAYATLELELAELRPQLSALTGEGIVGPKGAQSA